MQDAEAAPPAPKVALLPLELEGALPPEVHDPMIAELEAALTSSRYELVHHMPSGGRCPDVSCIHGAAQIVGAQYVLVPALAVTEQDSLISVRLYDFAGNLRATQKSTCELCSPEDVKAALLLEARSAQNHVVELIDNPYADHEAPEPEPLAAPRLSIASHPSGAAIVLDGQSVGKTPLTLEVEAGLRDLRVELAGYEVFKDTVRATRGQTNAIDLVLSSSNQKTTETLRLVGIIGTSVSVPLLAAGITLLALDENPYKSNCDGNDIDYAGNCRYRYDTLAGGAASTAVGLASLLAGVTCAVVAFGRRKAASQRRREIEQDTISVRPRVAPTAGGLRVRF